MNSPKIKNEGWLYMLAFLLAISLRLLQLGAQPLTDTEAAPALQAYQIALGHKPTLSPQPAYILLTSFLFFLFGSTNFLARLVPALAGAVLVFSPYLFRDLLKPRPALILAFFFAIEPGLLALSRQAASSILAITFISLAWGSWINRRHVAAGVCAALALLSGPALWFGLLGLGIAWAIIQSMESQTKNEGSDPTQEPGASAPRDPVKPTGYEAGSNSGPPISNPRKEFLFAFLFTLVTVGTFFFFAPNGLSAAAAALPEYLQSWGRSSGVPFTRVLASFVIYQPLAVLLAIPALIRGWSNGSRRVIRLSLWFVIALLLVMFHPNRQVTDLGWALLPLWALAALELARVYRTLPEERREVGGVALLTFLILVFAWFDLTGLNWTMLPSPQASLRIWLFFGAFFLLILSLLLIAAGWSIQTAKFGGLIGACVSLLIITIASAMGSAGLRGLTNPELWWLNGRPAQTELLTATAADLSSWSTGDDNGLAIVIAGLHSPSLEWALRAHTVTVVEALDPNSSPPIAITPVQEDPGLAAAYRGQDFLWRQAPAWTSAKATDWLRWITLRQIPESGETIILWARNDLFLDAAVLQ